MVDRLFAFLSLEYSGLLIALPIAVVAILLARSSGIVKWAGRLLLVAAAVLAVGAASHVYRVSQIEKRFPPPGQLVEVDGRNLHVLAEGPDRGPAVVWFAGGHIGGLGYYQHHAALRGEMRSILVDRLGTGWSDSGSFPRSTAKQTHEIVNALEAAGESGPFIFTGHSFGGLLAVNIARRYPEKTAAVVLMDPTPLDVVVYGLDKQGLRSFQGMMRAMTLARLFGFYQSVDPATPDGNDDTEFSDPMLVRQFVENRARNTVAAWSAFEELTPEGLDDRAFDTMIFDGELEDMPLYLVAPKDEDPSTAPYAEMVAGGPGPEADRFAAFLKSTRERYMAASSASVRVVAPPGTGHNFIYEDPDFVVATMRDIYASVSHADDLYPTLTTRWPGPHGGLPPVHLATPENMEAAFERAMADKRAEIQLVTENPEPATFENTIVPLESSGLALDRIQQLFEIFTGTASNPEIAAMAGRIAPKTATLADEIAHNGPLFARIEAVHSGLPQSAPDEESRRLVEVWYQNMVRQGASLGDAEKATLGRINADLAKARTRFNQNSRNDEARLVVFVDSEEALAGLPPAQVGAAKAAAEARDEPDRWAIPISRPSVWPLLTHALDRSLRQRVWRLWVSRGGNDGELDNGPVMTEILKLRGEKAKLLGYSSFAHYQTAGRMAGTPEAAMELMMRTWESLMGPTLTELAEMQAIADAEGADFELQPWDRLFYAEKLKQQKFNFDSAEVLPYFELDNIVDGMMWSAGQVYDFQFRELENVKTVAPEIRVFEVLRDDQVTGVIWMDLFAREGKGPASWAAQYRSAEDFRGRQIPLVVLHSAAQKPADGGPVLVPFERANVIFHEFGHTLQTLSNAARYPSLGVLQVPWDFIEVPSLLNERWLMTDEVLDRFALHHETGDPMPQALRARLRASLKHDRVFSASLSYLGGAIVDMRLHLLADGRTIDAEAVEREVISDLEMPQAVDLILYVPHAFHTFSPQYGAGVYTYLWSDVIAADIAGAFLESPGGLYDRDMALKYRQQILDIGHTRPVAQAYRDFRGRDPDPDALLKRFDLIDTD